nr:hypothetical protein [Tanacetum cinerariifolium]
MLEAVADQRLWIWHAYFGVPGANNDLNVLYDSPLFDDELADTSPECPFVVNGHTYRKGYYLADADGIYPQWSTFFKGFTIARDQKTMKFKRVQESARKNMEKAFGVLQDQNFDISEHADMYVSPEADGIYPAWSMFVKTFPIARDENPLKFKRVQEAARKDIERTFGVLQESQASSLDTGKEYLKIRTTFSWGRQKANSTPRVNIQEFCEEHYEDILPIIMEKVRHDRRKDVHTRDERHKDREGLRSTRESYGDSFSHSYRDGSHHHHMKRKRDKSPPSSMDGETIEDFMKRFKIETRHMKGAPKCMRISGFMHGVNNLELTKRLNEHVPKTMEEMMITTTAFIRGEAAVASKKKGRVSWKPQDQSKRHSSDKRSDFRDHSREGRRPNRFTPLTRTPKEIFVRYK